MMFKSKPSTKVAGHRDMGEVCNVAKCVCVNSEWWFRNLPAGACCSLSAALNGTAELSHQHKARQP